MYMILKDKGSFNFCGCGLHEHSLVCVIFLTGRSNLTIKKINKTFLLLLQVLLFLYG